MAGQSQSSSLCWLRTVTPGCWTDPATGAKQSILIHPRYDCEGVPLIAEDQGAAAADDLTKVFTDVAGTILDDVLPGDVQIGACQLETKTPIIYWELESAGAFGELRKRSWDTAESSANTSNTAVGAAIREGWDFGQATTSDITITNFNLDDINNTGSLVDVEVVDGWVSVSEPMTLRYAGGSEGYWAVELGKCCGPLEVVTEHAGTNTPTPAFTIDPGIHQWRGWNIDLGGTNSSHDLQYSNDGGATWTTDNTPPNIEFSRSKPGWACKHGWIYGGNYFAIDGTTAIAESSTLSFCEPSCDAVGASEVFGEVSVASAATSTETIVHGQNTSVPAGFKSVTINNISGTTTVDGVFELGPGRRLDAITYDASSHAVGFDGRLPGIALAGGSWQWTGIQ